MVNKPSSDNFEIGTCFNRLDHSRENGLKGNMIEISWNNHGTAVSHRKAKTVEYAKQK